MNDDLKRLADLSPEEKRLLLAQLLEKNSRRPKTFPLSFAQQRLWFLDQLEPGGSLYNIPAAVHLAGELNVAALEASFGALIERHQSLRTIFTVSDGTPAQTVFTPAPFKLPVVDLRGCCPADVKDAEVRRLTEEEAQRPFDLTQSPLFRVTLLRLYEREHVLLLTMHHIISDGWSIGVLIRELAVLYEAFLHGQPLPLPALPVQYTDYAVWQRRWLQGEVLDRQLEYWRGQLNDIPGVIGLPTDRPRPPSGLNRGATHSFVIPQNVVCALESLGQRENATLFMTLLAAFLVLLHRYSQQDDILVGTAIAGRTRPEFSGLIGFFVNTLVLRTSVSGNPSFLTLLRRVRGVCLGAYEHQDLPFEKLVEELQPERSLSHTPLFQVMFVLQNAPAPPLTLTGIKLKQLPVPQETAKFDLNVLIEHSEEGLVGSLQYATDLFEADTIARMARHFQTLLRGIVGNPEQTILDLPLLAESESELLLHRWNRHEVKGSETKACIHNLFEAQARRTPDAVAVVFEDARLTYGELDRRSNQLAHHLREIGVGPNVLVAMYCERSPDMLVGLLAVLKAGGAYVPIDSASPPDRVGFILEDTSAPLLLTQHHLLENLPEHRAQVICLDSDWQSVASRPANQSPRSGVRDGDLAYVIYTSGSTGRPKGVLVSHRNVVRLFTATDEWTGFSERDVWTLFHSYAFDFSVWEIWGALAYGGRLVIVPYWVSRSPDDFYQLLGRERVTILNQTPSAFRQLARYIGLPRVSESLHLRLIIFGGETLEFQSLKSWFDYEDAHSPQLINMYGITETTVHVTYHPVSAADMRRPLHTAIGRPLADLQLYLLDSRLNPVPLGVPGQIYVGGAGLTYGYLNHPELTAERFIPHPWSQQPGARLYKTGDLARRLPDGEIEFLGRTDNQVKIRGFRIELGEIEVLLGEHPSVRQAVVVPHGTVAEAKRLVAYVVSPDAQIGASELRDFLSRKLPEHMLPAVFVKINELPLTPNGKINLQALPEPAEQLTVDERDRSDYPATPVGELVANIWCQVLNLPRVGMEDNFFELGGHSLLATQLISRVHEAVGVLLPLRTFFASPTLRGMTTAVEELLSYGREEVLPITPVSRKQPPPVSFAQQRLWFFDQLIPGSSLYNMPFALALRGPLCLPALEQSLFKLTERHETLRTNFSLRDEQLVQIISSPQPFNLRQVDLSTLRSDEQEAAVRRIITQETQLPFNLADDPLFRACLLRLHPDEHVLVLTMHHIISDGWSMGLFVSELAALYEAFSAGRPSPLPELPVQYADYAVWQRRWLEGEVLDRQLEYWRGQLGGELPVLELPTDRRRPPVQQFRGSAQTFFIPQALADALKELSLSESVTLFMILLAALKVLLYRYTGQTDIIVGTPVAGRNFKATEEMVGFFVNTLVLRTDLSGDPTFRRLLRRVRETSLDAYAHQDLPFEKLIEELQPERDLSRSPLFQVMFALQNQPRPHIELHDLCLDYLEIDSSTAKFDLNFSVTDTGAGLSGSLEYNTDLFEASSINRMLEHLMNLLRGITANPDQRLSRLALLSDAERHQLLTDYNNTAKDYAAPSSLQHLFEAQAENSPDAIAVAFEDQQLTYGELNKRSNQLAHRIRGLRVGGSDMVGVFMSRSIEMVIGLLGILKAGAAYVPLDPELPQERIAGMLRDVDVSAVLTQSQLINLLPAHQAEVICLDDGWHLTARENANNPVNATTADSLAYVMFTSGSTGRPKGVMNSHGGIVNRLLWMQDAYRLCADDRVLQKTPYGFDVSVWEFFWPLSVGARLVLARPGGHRDNAYLAELIADQRITTLHFVPSMLQLFLEEPGVERCASLRRVICSGEVLPVELQERFFARLHAELHNLYGPTEAAIDVTAWTCKPGAGLETVPIGRPIANVQVYLLDENMEPVPPGAPGELYIGGRALARGYLNRPGLTAERFLPDPFAARPGSRLYRSGDMARYMADGEIEFLGRSDHQVKVRGFRVELGEVEAALGSHPAVRQSVVTVRERQLGDKCLTAYVVVESNAAPSAGELRAFLKSKLPDYMVPVSFALLDELPLTSSGKLDRKALTALDTSGDFQEQTFVPPRTSLEKVLADIWAEVLGIGRVSIDANFFDMGGHSLLATHIVMRLRNLFHIDVPLQYFFEAPTVASLAAKLFSEPQQQEKAEKTAEIILSLTELSDADVEIMLDEEASDREHKAS